MDGQLETVTIDTIGHKGDGVAETPTGPVFVPLSLPGETVEIERAGERGRIVTMHAPSPHRVAAPCPHFGVCGGCSLQHMETSAYLAFKRETVVNALEARGIVADVAPVTPVSPGTRRRAVVAVQRQAGADGAALTVGFRQRLSHTVADAAHCLVVTPAIRDALPKFARLADFLSFEKKGAIFTVIDSETGLDVSVADAKLPPSRRRDVVAAAIALGFARLSIEGESIVEARAPILTFGGVPVALPPAAFVQAVASAEAAIRDEIIAAVAGAKRIADLFAGSGTFSLPMARHAQVHAVEFDGPAIEALDKARRFASGLKAVSVEARDLNRRPLMAREINGFDAVVFDPPRDGAAPQAKEIAKSKVPTVVAVSCNPATLARDGRYLLDAGYRLERVKPVDQFLWSHHVEAVAVFRR